MESRLKAIEQVATSQHQVLATLANGAGEAGPAFPMLGGQEHSEALLEEDDWE